MINNHVLTPQVLVLYHYNPITTYLNLLVSSQSGYRNPSRNQKPLCVLRLDGNASHNSHEFSVQGARRKFWELHNWLKSIKDGPINGKKQWDFNQFSQPVDFKW
jgi:hypothetical protein